MTDQQRPAPDDEPVIGRDDLDTVFAHGAGPAAPSAGPGIGAEVPYEEYPDAGYDEYERYRGEFYGDEPPVRQPMFYVFLVLSVLVGGLFVFFLVQLVRGDGEGATTPVSNPASILISVDSPREGDRVFAGSDVEVHVRARANEEILRFELYRGPDIVDRVTAAAPDEAGIYAATLKMRFDAKGEFGFVVRAVTVTGAEQDSPETRVTVVENVGDEEKPVEGSALTIVTLRTGPGDNFAAAGQLQPGEDVVILGKTRDDAWLYVDRGGGLWVPAAAINVSDSLALVKVHEPTPTPFPPTATPQPSPSPSVTVSPTVPPDAPDFIPANAVLADAGATLRVTVANSATSQFSGALVVSVADIGAGGTLVQAFDVAIPANGSVIVEFDISPPVSEPKTARITVDPDLAIPETNEDNNSGSFGLVPPADNPELVIANVTVLETTMQVTIRNDGGPLAPSPVTVRVTVGTSTAETNVAALALAKGQVAAPIEVIQPGSGTATVQVLVDGQLAAELGDIEIP